MRLFPLSFLKRKKINDAAKAPVNEIVERNLTLALNEAAEKAREIKAVKKAHYLRRMHRKSASGSSPDTPTRKDKN